MFVHVVFFWVDYYIGFGCVFCGRLTSTLNLDTQPRHLAAAYRRAPAQRFASSSQPVLDKCGISESGGCLPVEKDEITRLLEVCGGKPISVPGGSAVRAAEMQQVDCVCV